MWQCWQVWRGDGEAGVEEEEEEEEKVGEGESSRRRGRLEGCLAGRGDSARGEAGAGL